MQYLFPGTPHLICKDALCLLIGFGQTAWENVMRMVKANEMPQHGLGGKVANRQDAEVGAAMREYFERLVDQAEPRATLII